MKNKWRLWKNKNNFIPDGITHYIWTEDNIIRHSRVIYPIGYVPVFDIWAEQHIGFNVHLEIYDFKPVKTKMTQEQLSKGWLFFS